MWLTMRPSSAVARAMRATSSTSNDAPCPIAFGNTVTFGVGENLPGESPAMQVMSQKTDGMFSAGSNALGCAGMEKKAVRCASERRA